MWRPEDYPVVGDGTASEAKVEVKAEPKPEPKQEESKE